MAGGVDGRKLRWMERAIASACSILRLASYSSRRRNFSTATAATLASARVETPAEDRYRLEARLRFDAGGEVDLVEERAPGLARRLSWDVECERGTLGTPPRERGGGLFARDLDVFIERIRSGAPSYVSDERVLHVLELVDAIDAAAYPRPR